MKTTPEPPAEGRCHRLVSVPDDGRYPLKSRAAGLCAGSQAGWNRGKIPVPEFSQGRGCLFYDKGELFNG
ncbi:hypothetical protein A6M21_01270 [Desulfotomaculum copahuensis]|uniref:Uncharacterized protein n=1 Tax=Desulfotomaculum copahuensis TaxID=1838280 RepID=A0A1B7LAN7_9FIRM|nr:hypothetical protein A6M21_01270 [Desulfotomaculum copahuensis]